jgi:hypothetical protein
MPIFEIQTPDGRTLDIEAGDEAAAIAGAREWYAANPDPKKQLEAEVRKDDSLGSRFRRFSDQVMDPFGLFDEITGAGAAIRGAVTGEGAGKAYDEAAERQRAERRVAREDNGWLGTAAEILGGLGTTGVSVAAPLAKGAWETAKAAAKSGAGYGAAAGVGQSEGGVGNRVAGGVEGGLTGAIVGPAISNVAVPLVSRGVGAVKSGYQYAKNAVEAARNPEAAAMNAVADQAVESGFDLAAARARVAPAPSATLQRRGLTESDMADVISRQLNGEDAATVGQAYGMTGETARKYLLAYEARNPTPVNLLDLAVDQQGYQGAMPLLRRARANYGIAPDANIAQALENRQVAQPGRVNDMLRQSKAEGNDGVERQLEDQVKYLAGEAKKEERQAYNVVRQQASPIDIGGPIKDARRRAVGRQGEIAEKLNKAVDLFYEPELRATTPSPMAMLRRQEAGEKLRQLQAEGADYARIARQRRLVRTLEQQEDWTNPLKNVKVGKPIKTVDRFLEARDELDQMIEKSYHDNKPTRLTGVLTEFRREINDAARSNNKYLVEADRRFYENRRAEELIKSASQLSRGLNPRSREAMREFEDLTPTQQELFRTAFEQNMADNALNVTQGNGAARQFGAPSFKQLVEAFYPKKAGKEVFERGQRILRNLQMEAITTNTRNFATGTGNSPTAPWQADMQEAMSNAQAGADLATGRFGRLLENLSTRLAKQIGAKASAEQLRIVTTTDPKLLLPIIQRLEAAAQTSAQRRQLVHDVRQLRAFNRPGVGAVTGQQLADGDQPVR